MSDTLERELGAISAKLENIQDGQRRHEKKLEQIDGRLRGVERKAVLNGAVSGGVIAVAISLIKGQFPPA